MTDVSQTIALPLWLDTIAKFAVPCIALVGALYTVFQYQRAQRWRAGDLAVGLLSRLETDDELAFACRALDWGIGPLVVPVRYRPLMEKIPKGEEKPSPVERGEIMMHDPKLLASALRVGLDIDPETEPGGLVYRYCFDKLFAHVANINRLLSAKQIQLSELSGLEYWLERIAVYEYVPRGEERRVFQPFLEHEPFSYRGVIELGERLGVKGWDNSWQK